MKKIFAALLALMLVMSAVGAFAEDAIIIGISGPLTGPYAMYGLGVVHGAEIAVEEVNALGGIQFALTYEDDEGDPEKAVNAYNKMKDDGAALMASTVTSGACAAVAAEAYNDRMFMLTPSASSPSVTEDRDNVFQVCFTDPNQGAASADYIVSNNLAKKVAVIYNNGLDYSTGIYQTFQEKANELGLEVVSVTTFSSDNNADFSVQLTKAKDSGAELVFLPIYYTPASMILKQAKAMDYAPIFFGVDGMDGILSIEGFDTSLAEGVYLLTAFSADAEDEKTQSFVKKYVERYGEIPNQFAADSYDAIYALYAACNEAGVDASIANVRRGFETVCEMLIEVMPEITVEGITGTMTWEESGEVAKTPTAVIIKDGVYVGAK